MYPPPSDELTLGRVLLQPSQRRVCVDGKPVPLGGRAFDLLLTFARHPGQLLSKQQLLDLVWPGLVVEENNLQVQISSLRKLLGAEAIETVPGRGYRLKPGTQVSGPRDTPMARAAPIRPPRPLSPMVGRDEELQQLESLLRVNRLVTIVGSGGVGKTRLAEAVAERRASADSMLWVDLAGVSDPALLPNALSLAAGVDSGSGADPLGALLAEWNGSLDLIILDNAEHVLEAAVELTGRLLNELASVRILVTSQAPLHITGEQVYRLEALALPAIGITDVAAVLRCPSVSLFMSRVRAANRSIELTAQNLAHVIDICRWLDGIPLALDLAAARVAQFGIEQVAQRLREGLQLLRSSGTGRPPRQQTLRAAYEWSYGLLTQPEQAAFRRLGAFVGAFSLQSAARVIALGSADEWDALDRLGALVDRSLVWLEPGEPPAYRLPESGRSFALEHLRATGDAAAIAIVADEYERAGDAASSRSANAEAVASYSAALATASLLPDPTQASALELRLHLKLGPAVQTALSPASPRCESIYRRSVELAQRTEDQHALFRAQWGYWQYLCLVGRDREAAEYAAALVALAATLRNIDLQLEALHADFTTRQLLGDAAAVVRRTAEVIALYDRDAHHRLAHEFGGHDAGVCALGQGSVALWLTGSPDQALEMAQSACALGRLLGHAYSHAVAHYYSAITCQCCGRTQEFASCARALIELSEQHSMEMLSTEGRLFLGRARFENGEQASGIDEMRSALASILATGEYGFAMFYSALLAEALIATAGRTEAEDVLQRALAFAEHGQGFFLPELYRLLGELRLLSGDSAGARAQWDAATTIAAAQGAVSLSHRIAISRARLPGAQQEEIEAAAAPPDDPPR